TGSGPSRSMGWRRSPATFAQPVAHNSRDVSKTGSTWHELREEGDRSQQAGTGPFLSASTAARGQQHLPQSIIRSRLSATESGGGRPPLRTWEQGWGGGIRTRPPPSRGAAAGGTTVLRGGGAGGPPRSGF